MVVSAPYSSTLVAPSLESYSLTEGRAVVVDPGLDRSGMLIFCFVSIMSFQWAEGKLGGAHLLSKSPRTGG